MISAIHPFSRPASSIQGHGGAGAYLQQSTGERRGPPWTGHQSIAGQHRDTQNKQPCNPLTPKGNLEKSINLTVMFLDYGRKPEYPERTHTCMGRRCKLHAERPLARSRTQDLLATRQQCYQLRVALILTI
ncbi:hypothetical protein ILYODFUR_016244 [Ilyodon furcidens]|uniref:Uncharacterized protein n=1 Tax=Ilyodon furcidens TaxID=33524 RepID=A0ABV0T8I0_9TELE